MMKQLTALFLLVPALAFAAANDLVFTQQKASGSGFQERRLAPVDGSLLGFSGSLAPRVVTLGTGLQLENGVLSTTGSGTGDLLSTNNLSDVDSATTARANLGLTIGTHVQAYDADLATYAGITPSANVQSLLGASNYAGMRTQLGLGTGDTPAFAGVTATGVISTLAGAVTGGGGFEYDGYGGISTQTPTTWASGAVLPRFRLSRPNSPNPGATPPHFLITPYEFGMSFEYTGVTEWWVKEFSVHNSPEWGGPAVMWVGDDTDSGGVRMTAVDQPGILYSEISSETFGGTTHGPLRFRVTNSSDGFEWRTSVGGIIATLSGVGAFQTIGNITASDTGGASLNAVASASSGNFTGLSLRNTNAGGPASTIAVIGGFSDNTSGAQIVATHDYSAASRALLEFKTRTNDGTLGTALTLGGASTYDAALGGSVQLNNAKYISWKDSGGTAQTLMTFNSGNAFVLGDGTGSFGSILQGANVILRTNGTTTALTLDSSQNATFAGTITATNLSLAGNFTTSGANAITLTTTGTTNVTLPTSGTLAVVGGSLGAATATTPSAADNDTSVATTAFVQGEITAKVSTTAIDTNAELRAITVGLGAAVQANSSTFASPATTTPLTLTAADCYGFVLYYGATGTVNLPAGVVGMNGIIYNTGAFTITIDANGSEVIVRDGTAQTGGVSITLSTGAGNYVALHFDGSRWVTLGYKGTLAEGS